MKREKKLKEVSTLSRSASVRTKRQNYRTFLISWERKSVWFQDRFHTILIGGKQISGKGLSTGQQRENVRLFILCNTTDPKRRKKLMWGFSRDWENVRKCNNKFAEIDEFAKKDKCWPALCQDSSEVIENEELSGFLKDLLELVKKVAALIMTILIKYLLFPWSIFFSNKYFLIKQIFSYQTNIFFSN